jgi:predicted transcriptional regulator
VKDKKDKVWTEEQAKSMLKNLLGSLELEVMGFMWQTGEATVQQVADTINCSRPIAYTTVMTVMARLTEKRLLRRTKEGKRYRYQVTQSREQYLYHTSRNMVRSFVDDFGDLAIAGFLGEVGQIDAKRLEQLRNLVEETGSESDTS